MNSAEQTLRTLADQIDTWQKSQRPVLTDAAMIKRFDGLGSSKTYSALRKGDFAAYNVEKQIANYQRVMEQLEEIGMGNQKDEIYENFRAVTEASRILLELMQQTGNKRVFLLEGPTGSSKTTLKNLAVQKFGGKVIAVDGRVAWKSANALLRDLLIALKPSAKIPTSGAERFEEIVKLLDKSNKVLWFDEGHRMNADGLNVIIDLVNRTESHFVLSGVSTIWGKLTATHYEEARQLLQNRLYARLLIEPPTKAECTAFLQKRCPGIGTAAKEAETWVQELAAKFGRFGFLYSLADRIRREGGELDAQSIRQLAEKLKKEVER